MSMDTYGNISVLPVEVIEKIFLYLSANDKLNVSLVCKQWLNIIDQPKLLRNLLVFVKYNTTCIIHSTFTRNFSHFIFDDLDITFECVNFFLKHGQYIKFIAFKNCSIELKAESGCKNLNICFNLESLEFEDCFLDIFYHLPCLKELSVSSEETFSITDRVLYVFQKTMPHLERFVLHHPAASANVVIKRFYPRQKKWTERPSDLILTLPAIRDFVHTRSKTLIHLSIRNKDMQPNYALSLFKSEHFKLRRLFLNKLFECVNIIPQICQYQTPLTGLHVTCLQISDAAIKLICSILPSLEAFTMQNNLLLDSSIVDIFQLKCLQTLGLESCSNIRLESFNNALKVFQLHNLRSLDLSSTKPDDECVRNVLRLTPKLWSLNLSSCLCISDETVHIICVKLHMLRFLALSGCKNVTDSGLISSQEPKVSLSNIKGLRELHLKMCPKITVNGLLESVKFLELQSLHIQNNEFNVLDTMQRLKTQNPSLRFDPFLLAEKRQNMLYPY